jgi:hypothetical protein
MRRCRRPALLLAVLALSACVVSRGVKIESVNVGEPVTVQSPVKAHLKDGSTVVFKNGVTVERSKLRGEGTRYDLRLRRVGVVREMAADEVMAMESFRSDVNVPASVGLSVLSVVAGAFAAAAAGSAIFGSCPTVYSDAGNGPQLEAELFSYSIVSLFEARDLDVCPRARAATGRCASRYAMRPSRPITSTTCSSWKCATRPVRSSFLITRAAR